MLRLAAILMLCFTWDFLHCWHNDGHQLETMQRLGCYISGSHKCLLLVRKTSVSGSLSLGLFPRCWTLNPFLRASPLLCSWEPLCREDTLRLSVQILNINNGRLCSHKLAQLSCRKETPFGSFCKHHRESIWETQIPKEASLRTC